jgi:hypothetical protein
LLFDGAVTGAGKVEVAVMQESLIRTIGALAGLVAGSFLVPQPLLGFRSIVHVAWDGSTCPPGDYSVTSTATNLQTGESFQTASATFALPAGTVGQDFPDLPDGTYHVIADVAGPDGQSFHSFSQTLTLGFVPPAPPPAPSGPIVPPVPAAGGGSGTGTAPPAIPGPSGPAEPQLQGEVPLAFALELLALFPADPNGGGIGVMGISATAVDVDGDGTIDFISITSADAVLTWRVSG